MGSRRHVQYATDEWAPGRPGHQTCDAGPRIRWTDPSAPLGRGQLLDLQRSAGNAACCGLVETSRTAREAEAGGDEPDQLRPEDGEVRTTALQVSAEFAGGSGTPGPTSIGTGDHRPKPEALTADQAVGPTGGPTPHAGGGNDCTPGVEQLDWNVQDAGPNWRANVVALRLSGDIHVTDWPSAPSTMTVPNTPNPVDAGNINNTAGSANRWQAAIDDMADYDNTGGGRGPNWHSTGASSAHEWAHWNEDYLGDTIPTANWTATNTDVDALTVPKAANPDQAAARTALRTAVDARFRTFVVAATRRWNAIINGKDKPGAGGRGYRAGMAVLNGHITAVRAHATAKGWTGTPRP
jgi:hypothetical protein